MLSGKLSKSKSPSRRNILNVATLHYSPRIRPDCVTLTSIHTLTKSHHTSQLTASKPMKKKAGRISASTPGHLTKDKTRPTFTYHAGLYGKFPYVPRFLTHNPRLGTETPSLVIILYTQQKCSQTNPDSCKMPNVDQDTGFRHPAEPDRSLRKYRDVDPGINGVGCLGMQLTPLFRDPTTEAEAASPSADDMVMDSWVEVGMDIEVLGRGPHRYARMFETDRPDI